MSKIISAAAPRRIAAISPLLAAGMFASGCMSSPTYGTGVSANEQLVNDVTGIVALAPKPKPPIDYSPRPELVRPAKGQIEQLPQPQQSVASANPDWPESPEERRRRLGALADKNRDNPNYVPAVINDVPASAVAAGADGRGMTTKQQDAEFRRRLAEARQGSSTERKYLSEPPLEYRQPAATAASDELGEDEIKKERRAKKQAGIKKSIKDYIPWL